MAKVLLFVQLIVGLVVLPLWPGLGPRYTFVGLVFLGLVLILPLAAVLAVHGPRSALRALADAWSPGPLRPGSERSVAAWDLAVRMFPLAGLLAGTTALIGALQTFDPNQSLAPQLLPLAFFSLVWSFLGLLIGRILHQVAFRLAHSASPSLLLLTPEFGRRFRLTPREVEAAQAVLDGLTYQGAADKLSISPATVKSHVLSVYQKTGAGNKIELLRLVEAETNRFHQLVDGRNRTPAPS